MHDLDGRKSTILHAIVIEYVTGAEPVASEQLVQKYELGVRSATVRNEMADLVEMGYLEQPHTSAGRVPSDLGYRHYVDRLKTRESLAPEHSERLQEVTTDGDALQAMLRDTARVLSRLTHLLGVATTVRDLGLQVRTAVVSALGPNQALLVLVLSNGQVENRMIECPVGLTLQDVGSVNEALAQQIVNKEIGDVAKQRPPKGANDSAAKLLTTIWTAMQSIIREITRGTLVTEGEEFLFAQPEFQRDLTSLSDLLQQLTQSDVLYEAVTGDQAQVVTIGRENRQEKMKQLSVIRQSFYVGNNEAGVIALVGPTRMRYDDGIPLVNYTAQALSQSLSRFFG